MKDLFKLIFILVLFVLIMSVVFAPSTPGTPAKPSQLGASDAAMQDCIMNNACNDDSVNELNGVAKAINSRDK